MLSLRPENVALHTGKLEGSARGTLFEGEVIDTIYLGSFPEGRVRVGRHEIGIRMDRYEDPVPGPRVHLPFLPERGLCLTGQTGEYGSGQRQRNAMDPQSISKQEMERYVARFPKLRGSGEAYIDTRLPGHRRLKINLIGMGVTEASENPDLAPNIPLPAHGFNLGMIKAEHGNGAALHAHDTEEVFMPLVGRWAVTWLADGVEQEIELDPFDTISVPIGVYRGFRYVGEGTGTLLTLIGGPEAGKVHWHPDVVSAAEETGLSRDEAGMLETA